MNEEQGYSSQIGNERRRWGFLAKAECLTFGAHHKIHQSKEMKQLGKALLTHSQWSHPAQ